MRLLRLSFLDFGKGLHRRSIGDGVVDSSRPGHYSNSGTRSIKYLEDNEGTFKVRLLAANEEEISNAPRKTELQGNRYPER